MNRRIYSVILATEAAVCLIFAAMGSLTHELFPAVVSFPFAQLGSGLRILSLSGQVGNVAAILFYIAFCIAPCAALLIHKRKRDFYKEDILLLVFSALLFVIMYLLINPGLINQDSGSNGGILFAKGVFGVTVYSVIGGYAILRALRLFFFSDTKKLHKYMIGLLVLVNALFVFIIFGPGANNLINSFKALREGNLENEHLLGMDYVFLVLQFLVDNIPLMLNILIVNRGIALIGELAENRYSVASVSEAENLSIICRVSLVITVLGTIAFNILQLIFSKFLHNINSQVQIPLFSIVFVLAVLLFSRITAENKVLKEDSDSII